MIDVSDYVSCPVCGGKARIVYVSRDEKQCVVKCSQRHTCGSRSVKGLCFLVDRSEVSKIEPYLSKLRKLVGLKLAGNSDV
jgi:NAD-dependent DNA ligase